MIFAMFYFFRDGDKIIRGVRSILPFDAEHRDTMMKQSRDLISASVTTSLIIAAIQGFSRTGIRYSEIADASFLGRGHGLFFVWCPSWVPA